MDAHIWSAFWSSTMGSNHRPAITNALRSAHRNSDDLHQVLTPQLKRRSQKWAEKS